ncbi:hypothetical protein SVAN01_02522 [Stagonosporopsis vannaccii]|nr:hypothetical protein SVAN01_02522 [Stagonosporopsis vannaccii]
MANFTLSRAIVNNIFKSLSVCAIAVAAPRFAFLCGGQVPATQLHNNHLLADGRSSHRLIAASVSSYHFIVLDYVWKRQLREEDTARKGGWELVNWWRS